jgi:hypothetical protein
MDGINEMKMNGINKMKMNEINEMKIIHGNEMRIGSKEEGEYVMKDELLENEEMNEEKRNSDSKLKDE